MNNDYTNEAQQRILRLLTTLSGNEIEGVVPSQIATMQSCSKSVVTRDLANLKTAGLAEMVPATGGWRLSPTLVQFAVRMQMTVNAAQGQLDATANRYTRT